VDPFFFFLDFFFFFFDEKVPLSSFCFFWKSTSACLYSSIYSGSFQSSQSEDTDPLLSLACAGAPPPAAYCIKAFSAAYPSDCAWAFALAPLAPICVPLFLLICYSTILFFSSAVSSLPFYACSI